MIYVALFRGINVGGNNKLPMNELKVMFESLGFGSVKTYINSGNVVFKDSAHNYEELPELINKTAYNTFKLNLKVIIRNCQQIEKVCQVLPKSWVNNNEMKSDVMFLQDETEIVDVTGVLKPNPDVDTIITIPGTILWNVYKKDYSKSNMNKIVGTKLYTQMTIRNVNTTRKLLELMDQVDSE